MSSLVRLPNAELLVSQFLRQDQDVQTAVGDNVYTEVPSGFTGWPAVRITRVGGAPATGTVLAADLPLMQFDVWGGPKATANEIAETIRAVLAQRLPWTSAYGTLGQVSAFGALHYLPDQSFDPPRPRYIFDAALVTRP